MLPYWLLFAAYAMGGVVYRLRPQDERLKSPLFLLAAVAVTLLIGFRFEIGADWTNYAEMFEYVRYRGQQSILTMSDPAYMSLNAIAADSDIDIWFVNLVCGAVFTAGLVAFARRQPNPWLAIAVAVPYLVIVVAMGYTRQSAAIGLIMWSIGYFEDRRYLRFGLLILLACAFHKSAVLAIPLIVLSTSRNRFAIYLAGAMAGAVLFTVFLDRFLSTFATTYLDSQMSSQGALVRVMMNVVPALVLLSFLDRFTVNVQERLIWRNFALATLATVLALAVVPSTAVDRIALYLIPLQVFVLSRAPYALGARTGQRNDQILIAVLAYSAVVQSVWLIFSAYARFWVPYKLWPLWT